MECSDWDFIFTEEVSEWIERYSLHIQGIYSYSNIYDNIPALWLDVLKVFNAEVKEAERSKNGR